MDQSDDVPKNSHERGCTILRGGEIGLLGFRDQRTTPEGTLAARIAIREMRPYPARAAKIERAA